MNKRDLILIGGGGHCTSCIDVIEAEDRFHIAGIVDIEDKVRQKVLDYEIIGSDRDIPDLIGKFKNFLITIGRIKDLFTRAERFNTLKQLGAQFPMVRSPLAYVSKHASIGEGTIVMHNSIVNANVRVGRNNIINTFVLVEHDVTIGDHCHITTGSVINGACTVGNGVFIGSNSVISNDVDIADNVIIGAGAVVTKSINQAGTYVGCPARRMMERV